MTAEWDLIAVGAGLAGLTAANRALELGQRALVLERSTVPRHECASRTNGGVFHVGFRSVMTDPDELVEVINKATGNFPDPHVARALAGHAARAIEWLKCFGTKFVPLEPTDGWKEHTLYPLGFHNKTTMEWKDLGADRLITRLEERVNELGGESIRGARVSGLIIEDGKVRGVKAQTAEGEKFYRAKAVVLADGGFEANKDMLRRFITSHPEHLHMRTPDSGNGDGMRMAEAAGGTLIGMEGFYGHLLSADCLTREGLSPFPFLEFLAATGMMVDANGERFVEEATGGHFTSNALARHGNALAHVVFDDAMWNSIGKHFFCPPNPNLVNAGGTLHTAAHNRRARGQDRACAGAAAPARRCPQRQGGRRSHKERSQRGRAQVNAVLCEGQASIASVSDAALLRGARLPSPDQHVWRYLDRRTRPRATQGWRNDPWSLCRGLDMRRRRRRSGGRLPRRTDQGAGVRSARRRTPSRAETEYLSIACARHPQPG